MQAIAIGIFCKAPIPGIQDPSVAPLRPEECAALSACFIRDLAGTIHERPRAAPGPRCLRQPEPGPLRPLLPQDSACCRNARISHAALDRDARTLEATPARSWSMPTVRLAGRHFRAAVDATRAAGSCSVPLDGGYAIGVSGYARLYQDIPWASGSSQTVERAAEIRSAGRERARLVRRGRRSVIALLDRTCRRAACVYTIAGARRRRAFASAALCSPDRRSDGGRAFARTARFCASPTLRRGRHPAGIRRRGSWIVRSAGYQVSSRRSQRPDLSRSWPPGSPRTRRRERRSSLLVSRWRCGSRWSASSR